MVTEISAFDKFYAAEDYHQDYFELNGHRPYCQGQIQPKLAKFRHVFHDQLQVVVESRMRDDKAVQQSQVIEIGVAK